MKLSPLQLEHYRFLGIDINPDYAYSRQNNSLTYPDFSDAIFKTTLEYGLIDNEEKKRHAIKLFLSASPENKGTFPYSISATIEGFFYLLDDDLFKTDMILVNGSSILFGILRDNILNITSKFNHGPVLLPTVSFIDLRDDFNKENPSK